MQLTRIDHVSLNCADRVRTLGWYAEVLDLQAAGDAAETAPDSPVFLRGDGVDFGLFADRAPGLRHVALATDAAGQEELIARLDRLGIAYKVEQHSGGPSVYFRDPDGATLEVLVG